MNVRTITRREQIMLEYDTLRKRVKINQRHLDDHIDNVEYVNPQSPYMKNLYEEMGANLDYEVKQSEEKLRVFVLKYPEYFI